MPHQCLKCGKVFPDGSPMILKGCPECSGTRFFFTEKPLDERERKRLTETASKDMKTIVRDVLTKEKTYTKKDIEKLIKGRKEWVEIKPKKHVKREGVIEVKGKRIIGVRKVKTVKKKEAKVPEKKEKQVKVKKAKPEVKTEEEKAPEVVNIVESGIYEIDVESLLEDSPVIVRRDGTYLVHLPSLFGKIKEKE